MMAAGTTESIMGPMGSGGDRVSTLVRYRGSRKDTLCGMRAVIQRVTYAKVEVEGTVRGEISPGVVVLVGVSRNDTAADAEFVDGKVVHLRIFNDGAGNMNRFLLNNGGAMLAVSQ